MARDNIVQMYVIDASVIIKWFIIEENRSVAIKLRDMHISGETTLTIPDLAIYEVTNALRFKPTFSPSELRHICQDIYDLEINIITPTADLIYTAANFAYRHHVTIYDAVYIALAKKLEFQFVTADEKLYRKITDYDFIILLSRLII